MSQIVGQRFALGTREQLIETATKLFYEQGAHWVSFQQIAFQVKISQPAVYKHFADKDDLMKACIIEAAKAGRIVIDQVVSFEPMASQKLKAYIAGNMKWIEHNPHQGALLLSMYYFALKSDPIKRVIDQIHQQSLARIEATLISGKNIGTWKFKNSSAVSRLIHDLLLSEMIKYIHADRSPGDSQERVNFIWSAVTHLISA